MPYIEMEARKRLALDPRPRTAGELNYVITCLIKGYIDAETPSYQRINDVVGALEGCKLEFYRRVATSYEETKILLNGDVYNPDDR